MTTTQDTPIPEAENTHPSDPHQTGSGSSESPGGGGAPQHDARTLTAGQEAYLGDPPGDDTTLSNAPCESDQ